VQEYLEKLKITLEVDNITRDDQQDPTLLVGLNRVSDRCALVRGRNSVSFTGLVHSTGEQRLIVQVEETDRAWSIGAFKIMDVKIHGVSVGGALMRCSYVPKYDDDFLGLNPDMPRHMDMVLHVGNRGTWSWRFDGPVYNNKSLNIGLW